MTADQIPLDTLIGTAVILDFTNKGKNDLITEKDLHPHEKRIHPDSRVLIKTGWDVHFTTGAFYEHFPCLTQEAAEFFVSLKIGLLGVDTPSPSPLHDPYQAIHKTLLGAGIVLLEGIKNLTLVDRNECRLIVLPLPVKNFSGAPCRVVAILGE